jgi:hypothetical protein
MTTGMSDKQAITPAKTNLKRTFLCITSLWLFTGFLW